MQQRVANLSGNVEERWFTMLKLGEINERYFSNWAEAERWYLECTKNDSARADAFFYLGQHYRLAGVPWKALPFLDTAASLEVPERSLFQWHFLYNCLSKVEFARAVSMIEPGEKEVDEEKEVNKALRYLYQAKLCDAALESERKSLIATLDTRRQRLISRSGDKESDSNSIVAATVAQGVKSIKSLVKFVGSNVDDMEEDLDSVSTEVVSQRTGKKLSLFKAVLYFATMMDDFTVTFKNSKDKSEFGCREYRLATTPYLRFFGRYGALMRKELANDKYMDDLEAKTLVVRNFCRL